MMHQPRRQQLTADLWAKAGELEKQFASYKKKVEKSDQAKEESTPREKKDGRRGELYERYMRIRDEKLREQLCLRMERKGAEMTTMWEQLEKSRVEMAARFAGAGKVGPVRTPSPSAPKKTVQLKREVSDEKKGRDSTPRSTSANTRRLGNLSQASTPSSSQSSITRTPTVPQSPRRSNTNSTDRTKCLRRLNSPARSAAIFSDLRKENKTPTAPRTRVLTKSHSLVLEKHNAKGQHKKPSQTENNRFRISETSAPLESKEDAQINITNFEGKPQAQTDATLEPVVTLEDDILPKLKESLTEMVNNEMVEEILSVKPSSSLEMLDHVEPNIENNDNNDNMNSIETDKYDSLDTVSNVNSILNPAIDKDGESLGESSRSWCSNLETSISRSTIDPAIDSPILSPHRSGSTSFRFVPEPSTIRVRKKWESRSINSPRGIKKFLSFGKNKKGTEILADEMLSPPAGLNTIIIDDENDNASNVLNRMSLVSYESNGSIKEIESENGDQLPVYQQAHALTGSLAASGAKYDQKEDCVSVNTQKSHRSFFAFPPFLFRGAESKIRS